MGFVRATLRLQFDDPELEGFEVRARRLNVDQLLGIGKLRHLAGLKDDSPEVRTAMDEVFKTLAGGDGRDGILLSWNLEEPKDPADPDSPTVPVPLSPAGLARQDLPLIMSIVDAITEATTAVRPDLKATSSAGVPSAELQMPMDVLSESPTS